MSDKEKITAGVLAAGIVLFVVAGLGWFFVWEPYSEASGQLEAANEEKAKKQRELDAEEATIKGVLTVNPRLNVWQDISVPPRDPALAKATGISEEEKKRRHVNNVKVEYEKFLSKLLADSGLVVESVAPSSKNSPAAPAKGKEQPVFDKLAFAVKAKGNTTAAVKALREFHKTPLLHQVRNVTLALPQRQAGGKAVATDQLDVTMTVEALMVTGAKDRATLLPPSTVKPRVLAEGRDYLAMAKVNMFTGYEPPAPPREKPVEKPKEKTVERPKQTEDRRLVLGFIKVTTITWNLDRGRWEAYLYDQSKGPRRVVEEEDGERKMSVLWEKKLNERILNELKIYDRYNNATLDAKVAFLGEKVLILKDLADNKYYKLGVGDNLYEGTSKAMTEGEALQYGLKTEPVKKKVEEEEE